MLKGRLKNFIIIIITIIIIIIIIIIMIDKIKSTTSA
jgi:hypothetical protein